MAQTRETYAERQNRLAREKKLNRAIPTPSAGVRGDRPLYVQLPAEAGRRVDETLELLAAGNHAYLHFTSREVKVSFYEELERRIASEPNAQDLRSRIHDRVDGASDAGLMGVNLKPAVNPGDQRSTPPADLYSVANAPAPPPAPNAPSQTNAAPPVQTSQTVAPVQPGIDTFASGDSKTSFEISTPGAPTSPGSVESAFES